MLVAFRALPNLSYPLGNDQATYCVIGQGLLRGAKLYRDLWDMKPPGIFGIYAGVVKLFGPVMWSVGVVDILWLLAISWCIFRFAQRYLGTAAAVVAVVANASWHCQEGYVNAAQPETFLILFVFAAYLLVWREGDAQAGLRLPPQGLLPRGGRWPVARHFAAGVLLGAACWMKYNAVAFLPFLLLVPYVDLEGLCARPLRLRLLIPWGTWLRRARAVVAGWCAAILAVLAYFWLAGSWAALWESHFAAASRYGSSPLRNRPDFWMVAIVGTVAALGPWTLTAAALGLLIAWKKRELARLAPLWLGAAFGYASVVMQLRFAQYAFENCYAFFAIAWGYLAVKIFEGLRSLDRDFAARGGRVPRAGLWVLFVIAVLVPIRSEVTDVSERYRWLGEWRRNANQFYANYPAQHPLEHLNGQMQVIRYLNEQALPGDGLYVWGAHPLIYYLTGLRSPSRFVPNLPLMAVWGPPAWREELVHDLRRSPPAFIIVARNDAIFPVTFTRLDSEQYLSVFPALNAFISDGYQRAATFPDFVVYRRKAVP